MTEYSDRFLILEGKRFQLLCRDEHNLYLVPIGKYRSRKLEKQLSRLSVAQMVQQADTLKIEIIPLTVLQGIALGGVEEEDPLYLYLPEKRRRLTLRENLRQEYLDWFFSDVKHHQPPKDSRKRRPDSGYWRKELQNPEIKAKLKWLKPGLLIGSIVAACGYLAARTLPWLLACGLCVLVPVVLDICLPAYFTLEPATHRRNRFAISLQSPLLVVCFVMVFTRGHYWGFPWRLAAMAAVGAVASALLMLLAQEFRRKKELLAEVLLLAFLLWGGFLQNFNRVLPQPEPETTVAQVVDLRKYSGSRGRGSTYYCTFQMPDGETYTVKISGPLYRSLEDGSDVLILTYEGALGVSYYRISEAGD